MKYCPISNAYALAMLMQIFLANVIRFDLFLFFPSFHFFNSSITIFL